MKNELLPLRTVVQLLYFEQEKKSSTPNHHHHVHSNNNHHHAATSSHQSYSTGTYNKVMKSPHEVSRSEAKHRPRSSNNDSVAESNKDRLLALEFERKMVVRGSDNQVGSDMENQEGYKLGLDPKKIMRRARSGDSDYAHNKR